MDDTLIPLAGGAGLIGIDSGDQDQPVLHFFIYFCQPVDIIADGILVVRGAGTDNHQEFIAFAGNDIADFPVALRLQGHQLFRERVGLPDLGRCGQFLYKFKTHTLFFSPKRSFLCVFASLL